MKKKKLWYNLGEKDFKMFVIKGEEMTNLEKKEIYGNCLLYTSDAADEL